MKDINTFHTHEARTYATAAKDLENQARKMWDRAALADLEAEHRERLRRPWSDDDARRFWRDREIVALARRGITNREIGERVGLSAQRVGQIIRDAIRTTAWAQGRVMCPRQSDGFLIKPINRPEFEPR